MKWPDEKAILKSKRYVKGRKRKDKAALIKDGRKWTRTGWANKLSYEITWLGIPIIQLPEDMILMQEVIFKVRPDIIVESGIAHGGSLIYYASLMEILRKGKVIGVDIEIRKHNRKAIENHPMMKRIELIEGSSTDPTVAEKVRRKIPEGATVMVCLDSDHSREHVFKELEMYHDMVTLGSYLVVFDTIMPQLTGLPGSDTSWGKNNPMEAVKQFLKANTNFKIYQTFNKLFVSYCPDGFLRRIR